MANAAPVDTPPASPAEPSADDARAALIADVFGVDVFDEKLAPDEPSPTSPVGTGDEGGTVAPAAAPPSPAPAPAADPQAPGSATPVQQQPAAPAAPVAAGQPAPAPAPEPSPAAPVDPALKIASLEAELATARAAQVSPPPADAGQPAGTPPAFDPAKPEILPVQLPANVLSQLFGEEATPEQTAAINGILSAISSSTLHRARLEFHHHLGEIRNGLQSKEQAVEQAETARVAEERRNGYYASFPHHNSPLILPILKEETGKLAAELPGAEWNDAFVAALGQRVDAALTAIGVAVPTAGGSPTATQGTVVTPAAAAPTVPAARPAAMMPTGSRPAPEAEDIVRDTFSWDN